MTNQNARVAQAIWQMYAADMGQALPAGEADRLAHAAINAMKRPQPKPKAPKPKPFRPTARSLAERIRKPVTEADWELYDQYRKEKRDEPR